MRKILISARPKIKQTKKTQNKKNPITDPSYTEEQTLRMIGILSSETVSPQNNKTKFLVLGKKTSKFF
jgi:hypothetical protein